LITLLRDLYFKWSRAYCKDFPEISSTKRLWKGKTSHYYCEFNSAKSTQGNYACLWRKQIEIL